MNKCEKHLKRFFYLQIDFLMDKVSIFTQTIHIGIQK
jgi:hypothetical protein